ncbi:replication initiation protein [Massilia sp. DWR3-1-1]|uniref:replication initiation protein n=1 Tax=Massilia sp. DWR3-1-1 TaxID=2804559 RepID=UPI003CE6F8DB
MPNDETAGSQMALALLFEQQPEILKKPVQAIHMAITGGIQNKTQRLAFNAMLKHALEEHAKNPGVNVDSYSISRVELMRIIDYTSPNRKHLKDALLQMQKLTVQWDFLQQDGDAMWASCVLLPFVGFDRDRVYYSYSPQIKPMLFDSKIYARLDLRIQRTFKLDSSAALYEWVNRFRTNPSKLTNEMIWEDWRWVIYGEVNEKSVLNEFKLFKREKLKPAIKEINEKSDLTIELIENKDGGRSVKYLQFRVEEKSIFRIEAPADSGEKAEWETRLEEMGIGVRDRKKIMSAYSTAVIEATWRFTMTRVADKSQTAIKNIGAYMKRALEGKFAPESAEPAPAAAGQDVKSMREIQSNFTRHRTSEAEAMFKEMPADDRDAVIAEYNELQTNSATRIPEEVEKQGARFMVPLYSWLAVRHWGEPTPQDIFQFAIESGAISVNKQQ